MSKVKLYGLGHHQRQKDEISSNIAFQQPSSQAKQPTAANGDASIHDLANTIQSQNICDVHDPIFDKKVGLATEGLVPFFQKVLRERISKENAVVIVDCTLAAKREINLSTEYRRAIIQTH